MSTKCPQGDDGDKTSDGDDPSNSDTVTLLVRGVCGTQGVTTVCGPANATKQTLGWGRFRDERAGAHETMLLLSSLAMAVPERRISSSDTLRGAVADMRVFTSVSHSLDNKARFDCLRWRRLRENLGIAIIFYVDRVKQDATKGMQSTKMGRFEL